MNAKTQPKLVNLSHIAALPVSATPCLSLYLHSNEQVPIDWQAINRRLKTLAATLTPWGREKFEIAAREALASAQAILEAGGCDVAIFSRGGENGFLYHVAPVAPLQRNCVLLDLAPCLEPLLAQDESVEQCILVHLDHYAARIEEWRISPEFESWCEDSSLDPATVAARFGRECFQHHRREQSEESLLTKIDIIASTLVSHGKPRILLTGKAPMVERLLTNLPDDLREKTYRHLVDPSQVALSAVVQAEGLRFARENAKWPSVTQLRHAIWRDGLGVSGFESTDKALALGKVDTIMLSKEHMATPQARGLMKRAMQHDVGIKVVDDSHTLLALGGVGALLREPIATRMETGQADQVALTNLLAIPGSY